MKKYLLFSLLLSFSFYQSNAQQSVARRWNEVMLHAVREDFARPPVQARNLYNVSLAMYDAWAAYNYNAKTIMLGNVINNVLYPYTPIYLAVGVDTLAAQNMAISYAAYRVLKHRFANSPKAVTSLYRFDTLMNNLGYDINYFSSDYQNGTPADLGNYIAQKVIQMGYADGSNEAGNYTYVDYAPANSPLKVDSFSNTTMTNPNRWQPLTLTLALDQGGNPIPSTPTFICPEWGRVSPYSMDASEATTYFRNGGLFPVYKNPGAPPTLDTTNVNNINSELFKWGHTMVAVWSAQLDPNDTTMIDNSPNSFGNTTIHSSTFSELKNYYKFFEGGDTGKGYAINPITNMPYTPNLIKMGDYTRVVSQFWADGPKSETPPGHWFVLLNKVSDHPQFVKKMQGVGNTLSDLEWDVKSYITLGGAMHDAAIAAWGIKGWYDSPRPISAIRKMALYGQSSDSTLPNYHPAGLPLYPNYIEQILVGDPLAGNTNQYVNKIKIKSWLGHSMIADSSTDIAGVGWILAENWMPYQRKTFVTPPFAGYVSGHSTYSRAAAEILTLLTGSKYFPGGLGEYEIPANSGFLVIEKGPTTNVKLQWATYLDASNEASLSRIWGGIHPPFDDMPGRLIGQEIGIQSFNTSKYFFNSSPLPLTLHSYSTTENNCDVVIEWETSNEINVSSFTLLHSIDGKNYDIKIAEIPASISNEVIHHYRITDYTATQKGYYKLIENDIDNKTYQIGVSSIQLDKCFNTTTEDAITIYPNPSKDILNIRILSASEFESASIEIVDLLGRKMTSSSIQTNEKVSTTQLDIHSLPKGNYFVQVTMSNGNNFVRKITKQ